MAWNSNFRKGADLPTWDWLSFFPQGSANQGTCNAYDGTRFIYWWVQYGSTSAASTTQLWRYDTWTDAWHFLATSPSNSFSGADMTYDPVRNCLWITLGNTTTTWYCYNLNLTNITVINQMVTPFSLTSITTVLPATAGSGASLTLPDDIEATEPFDTGTLTTGNTTTNLFKTQETATWNDGMLGLTVRMTSGAASGQRRTITAVNSTGNNATVAPAFGSAPASGDTYVIEFPQGTATSGTTTTLVDTGQAWTTNIYSNSDVLITAGTGSGQRRRIASNTGTTLTLAAAVTGNPRTGNWTTAPDATSVYKIVPSSDFLYYQPGNSVATLHRIDVATGLNASAWTSLTSVPATVGTGGDLMHTKVSAPFYLLQVRGNASSTVYRYSIGLNSWSTWTTFGLGNTATDGTSTVTLSDLSGAPLAFLVNGTTQILGIRQTDKTVFAVGTLPYAAPASRSTKIMRYVQTADGVKWLYIMRVGGQEFYRLALEY